jgi:hypothetical protein
MTAPIVTGRRSQARKLKRLVSDFAAPCFATNALDIAIEKGRGFRE